MPPKRRKQAAPKSDETVVVDPETMKVADLKEELQKRGLDTKGKKAELVERLKNAISGGDEDDATDSKPKKGKAEAEEDEEEEGASLDPETMKVADLKAELQKRGLDVKGKKAELVQRLKEALDDSTDSKSEPKAAKTEAKPPKEEEKPKTAKDALKALGSSAKTTKKTAKIDSHCFLSHNASSRVWEDFDCMLNQTNIGFNNNKFYVIQMISAAAGFYVWNRWGRVGEVGQSGLKGPFDFDAAKKEFAKKFKDKTKNDWDKRSAFVAHPKKYTLIEMEGGDDDEEEEKMVVDETDSGKPKKVKPCTLDKPTQSLVKLIFDHDMFKEAMASMEIDTKKMPLGKISKAQIAKGFEVLEEIEKEIKASRSSKINELSSKFYTLIPHSFGRSVPPPIRTLEHVRKKMDMLLVLADIEIAQTLEKGGEEASTGDEVDHPLDVNYKTLNCTLKHVAASSDIFKIIQNYIAATGPAWRKLEIMDVWELDRKGEGDRFAEHEDISARRLLWHGTNVAVVAAILKGGLRIMPHSGGRVGKGIYFASENSKSAGYVRTAQNTGIMFLAEVALGKEHTITRDDWTLVAPPPKHDCIVARGHTEPEPHKDVTVKIEGKDVVVPQGKPVKQEPFENSSFTQSEYLVYKESQARLRYVLKLKM